ncbi:MAG: hypothetical protein HY842_03940, partial [Bacteroidetes bacterium]|nr:hypothetical protein [Bacteroidota bacterium]
MRNLLLPAFVALGISFATPLHATHIIGGELSYQYLGNDTFLIKLDLYRDCNPGNAALDPLSYITIFNDNGVPYPSISLANMNLQFMYSDSVPNNIAGDPCLFVPDNVCVQHARYQRKFKLTGAGGFTITYQRCCRNSTIANIYNPLESGATYWLYISPLAKSLNNSSPQFGFYPPVFVCINKPIEHPHAATDVNGDSLVYKFYTPYLGGSETYPQPVPGAPPYDVNEIQPPPYDTVVWVDPPYNLTHLLGPGTNPLIINSQTGLITGLPQIQGQFVVGVLVQEYRNGQLLSVVRRDFQYNVGECAELNV